MTTTVLWRPVSNGVADTRMCCVTCRSSHPRKCKHELQCERETVRTYEHEEFHNTDSDYEEEGN